MTTNYRRPILVAAAIATCLGVIVAGDAGAATGDRLILGHINRANAATSLRNTGTGTALKLSTANGSVPALSVSNKAKVTNLNADELDGLSSSAFERVASRSLVLTPDPSAPQHALLAVPGLGTLLTSCSGTDANLFFVKPASVAEVDLSSQRLYDPAGGGPGDAVITMATFALTSTQLQFAAVSGAGAKGRYVIQLSTPGGGGRVYTATVTLTSQDDNIGAGKCVAWAQLD